MICSICNKPYSSFEQYDPHECLSKKYLKEQWPIKYNEGFAAGVEAATRLPKYEQGERGHWSCMLKEGEEGYLSGEWIRLSDIRALLPPGYKSPAEIRRELQACGNPLNCEGSCQGCSGCAELLLAHNARIRREALEDAIADISESCGPSVWDALEKLRALAEGGVK